ncbi:MAG: sialate O-acetylesterase [Ginsengibacter sp.]
MKKIIFPLVILFISHHAYSLISLPKIFGDNMVLQRDKLIPVWGWAEADEKITVQFATQTKTIVADKNGKWLVKLDAVKGGGPYELVVNGKNTLKFTNVLVGEVWICSGQSNMEMPIEGWGKINNYQQEVAAANYPYIRHIKIPNRVSALPENDIQSGEWKVCNPQNAGDFTATGYFFARELYNRLKVPIGLINTSWGGTMVETWTSRNAFEQSDEFKNMISKMPSLNLDSLSKIYKDAMIKQVEEVQGSLVSKDIAMTWNEANIDDSKWQHMNLPGQWEQKGLDGLDGVVWFRRTIDVSAADAGQAGILELSMIDDNDITYVNGVKVGSIYSWNTKRKYTIPPGIIKEGRNSIAIRVEDTGGGGGVYGDSADMRITINGSSISLAGNWLYRVESIRQNASVGPNDYPTLLFNAMVNPLIPYAMRGALWYQGEANAGRAYQYRQSFPLMIKDWRSRWNAGDFPFYFVQLASFNASNGNSKNGSSWAELREAQAMALSLPNTGMAVTTDIGDSKDIHPKNKQDVGKRLAAIALQNVYGKQTISSGPVYDSMQIVNNTVKISFKNVGSGLTAKSKNGNVSGFEIAGPDRIFYPAKAFIKGNNVIILTDMVRSPKAVRFGWADDAGDNNLFNKEGFPAGPFRTDKWKGITENQKFDIVR